MAWGGKGRIFKCEVLFFNNNNYISNIIQNFPMKKANEIK